MPGFSFGMRRSIRWSCIFCAEARVSREESSRDDYHANPNEASKAGKPNASRYQACRARTLSTYSSVSRYGGAELAVEGTRLWSAYPAQTGMRG